MKFIFRKWKLRVLTFAIVPALILVVFCLLKMGWADASTEVPGWAVTPLNSLVSAHKSIWKLVLCVVATTLAYIYFNIHEMPRAEAVRAARVFDVIGGTVGNVFYLWGGILFAWSVGSRFISFIERIPDQEMAALMSVLVGVFFEVAMRKLKHSVLRH
ncbi:hypothetical protein C1X59_09530 [Pseudomonas sp. FW215-R2]|jgi:hypothetical protein|uniref:hypothetical protein n=1 Tax=unclassified Pseudomonas TaxID=196821 RepID=UPI000C8896B7|nr:MULTISPECIES: hypothetical protein [unclassified Pseudomonas]PMX02545.1 hypothetical protein C1X59_09530 [Pseudomonas sp. FW215-R2]PMX11231.1 hypothetical protein C1X60_08820 [Pseudomonas sp. FW215-L1]PMX23276.1 hypothetical protein C1X57_12475 [Pseudomonas sp. FW215-E1]PNA30116.1 hypothetical protein C1X58_12670 [Pseudomonas sp. FW215-R4]